MSPAGSFANRWNLDALEAQYQLYRDNPDSVERDWQLFFAGLELGMERPPEAAAAGATAPAPVSPGGKPGRRSQQEVDDLIYAYRDLGHTVCDLDPLGINNQPNNQELELETFGLSETQLDLRFATATLLGLEGKASLREIIAFLRDTYCGTIGVEYMHITDSKKREYIRRHVEQQRNQPRLTLDEKRRVLIKLSQAELLEKFIHTKFFGQKRFSLEGCEALIPALDALIENAPDLGCKEIVLGMAHRGRLNVLTNIMNKSYEEVFTEFEQNWDPSQIEGNGDVKYHMGFSTDHITTTGRRIHLTLTANPSHLEAVDPVVLGRVRAKQRQYNDTDKRSMVIPILIHGDAAIAGQGLVMETFQLSQLDGYRTGGTVHIVTNNQIGFTTLPHDSRSTRYCTDIGKMVEAPIFHVNGDDIEGVVHAIKICLAYRQEFGADVLLDIVCYRRYGHNEGDEPNYTQPTLYKKIASHPTAGEQYVKKLLERGDLCQDEVDGIAMIMKNQLQDALDTVKVKPVINSRTQFKGVWSGMTKVYDHSPVQTGIPKETLLEIGAALSTYTEDFNIHPTIKKLADRRAAILRDQTAIDYAFAELLAFGSLLLENTPVRLSGQDCRRGTFSQRHSYWYDVATRQRYAPLNNIRPGKQAKYCVYNSPLSELAVMGFDYGYSLAEPNMLIIWEAQFGDFVNGAQIIIDQFLVASEEKWGRVSGLVLMLPHGQEGAGPEHSSARLERWLQACAENNIQVAYVTSAAQHFHVLRRQMNRSVRKPLILMTPKSHLRSAEYASPIEDFTDNFFHEVIDDRRAEPSLVRDVILCTGKIYHELVARRDAGEHASIAIVRIEQLYPFPEVHLKRILGRYDQAKQWTWCQEEPENAGAWSFMQPRLRKLSELPLRYSGREESSTTAPGSMTLFKYEQEKLLAAAIDRAAGVREPEPATADSGT